MIINFFSDVSCPVGQCSIEDVCSMRPDGGHGCCLAGQNCLLGLLSFIFFLFVFLFFEKKKKKGCGDNGIEVNEDCACSSGYLGQFCTIFLGNFTFYFNFNFHY